MTHPRPGALLARYFAGLSEQTFLTQLGVADPRLIDYLSDLLIRFVRTEALHGVRDTRGRPIRRVGEMLVEAEARLGPARREVHRHIGDFTLFWAGLYPEALQRGSGEDAFADYCRQGKRAYFVASTIETDEDAAPGEVLARLSEQFEMCAYGLREVRREWERRDDEEPPRGFLIN